MEYHTGQPHSREDDAPHEDDFQDRAVGGIPGCAEGIVLCPVAHTDDRGDRIDEDQTVGDPEAFPAHAHDGEDRSVGGNQDQAYGADEALAEVDQAPGTVVGNADMSCADLGADQDGGGVGKAGKKADHQAFEGPENGQSRDGFLGLPAKDDVDHHIAGADQDLVHDDGEAFLHVNADKGKTPGKVPAECEQVRMAGAPCEQYDYHDAGSLGDHGCQGCTAHAHRRQTEITEDQDPVQRDVYRYCDDGTVEGDTDLFCASQEGGHRHRVYHQRIGETYDPQVLHTDLLDGGFICIQAHHLTGKAGGQDTEDQADRHHAGQRKSVGPVDAVVVFCAPVLREEEHAASYKTPVAAEHQGGKLGAEADSTDLGLAQGGDHHGIHHGACGCQEVLHGYGDGDYGDSF